jgi:hypothetical protein
MPQPFYSLSAGVLTEEQRVALINGVLSAAFYGPSALGKEFVDTQGFSLVFRRSALQQVTQQFDYFRPVLDAALFEQCNAFYINPLVLCNNSRVDAHVDCRLTANGDRLIPNLISVFYAEVDVCMKGGRIIFRPETLDEVRLAPRSGDLLHFVGSTVHSVEEMQEGRRRISVVCEQYNLDEKQLLNFPLCEVITGSNRLQRLNAAEVEG